MMERRQQLVNSIMQPFLQRSWEFCPSFPFHRAVPGDTADIDCLSGRNCPGKKMGDCQCGGLDFSGRVRRSCFCQRPFGSGCAFQSTGGYIIGFLLISWISGTWIPAEPSLLDELSHIGSVSGAVLCLRTGGIRFIFQVWSSQGHDAGAGPGSDGASFFPF